MNLTKTFSSCFKKLGNTVKDHSPELLAGAGLGLWVVSSINAVLAAPKAYNDIQKKKSELNTEKLTVKETVKTTAKYYAGPLVGAGLGTACIIASVTSSNKRYLALSSAYEFANETFQIYRDKVVETIGEKKEQSIQDKVAQERLDRNPLSDTSQVIITGNGESLCYDSFSGRYFKFDIGNIKHVENQLNDRIVHMNYVSLNEMYSEFGLEHIDLGYELGWNIDTVPHSTLLKFQLSSKLATDGRPCLVIGYNIEPKPKYEMFG